MPWFFKDVDFPVVAQRLFPWSRLFSCSLRFSQLPYTWWLISRLCSCFRCHRCSSECERRCIHAATSSSSSLGRMGPRSVHRPLCWERLRGILLRPGRGYAPFGVECDHFFGRSKRFRAENHLPVPLQSAIQTFLCGGSRLPFGSGAIPFRENPCLRHPILLRMRRYFASVCCASTSREGIKDSLSGMKGNSLS